MTWALAFVVVAAMATVVALAHVALPYIVKRSEADTKLAGLEAANAALSDRIARVEQSMESMGVRGLPRMGASR